MPTAGEPVTCGELLKNTEERLLQITGDAGREAWFLFSRVFEMDKAAYYLKRNASAEPVSVLRLNELTERRLRGEPLQYILGEWEFYGLPFSVWPGVLIPRPETELLADTAILAIKNIKNPRVLELCCGSGCVAVCIAKIRPDALVTAADLYPEPLKCTAKNSERNGVELQILKADVLLGPDIRFGKYDLIVANPPYINESELAGLQKELSFEPECALNGGGDGLRFYRGIISEWSRLILPGGIMALEIGSRQREQVTELLLRYGFSEIVCHKDLSGHDRVVQGSIKTCGDGVFEL